MSTEDRVAADRARFREWARYAREHGDSPAIAAATVVLLRNTDDSIETLMLRKNSRIAFGGMWVFPGGRVDDSDRIGVNGSALDDLAAARNAAAREAHEEAEIDVDPDSMVIFAHWIPPAIAPKRYATWFFAARVNDRREDEGAVKIDEGEIVEGEWMTPKACLQRHHEGEIELAPPTWVTLATLRDHHSAKPRWLTLKLAHPGTTQPAWATLSMAPSPCGLATVAMRPTMSHWGVHGIVWRCSRMATATSTRLNKTHQNKTHQNKMRRL